MLPAAAALAWAVLGYICVDFGFLEEARQSLLRRPAHMASGDRSGHGGKPFPLPLLLSQPQRWHTNLVYATLAWIGGLGLLAGVAVYDPAIAAGVARLSFALTAAGGVVFLILFSASSAMIAPFCSCPPGRC